MTNFDQQHERRHSDAIKWQVKPDELPMWIADMDFQTAPAIQEAMHLKVDTGIFGYEDVPADYYAAVADWYDRRHSVRPQPDWMLYVNGVIPALSSIVRRMTAVGDNVVVQAPVYDIFYHSIENNGRHTLSSDLQYDENEHFYRIDFADLEAKLAQPLSTLMILCNPHNPMGRVWDVTELTQIAALCQKHHVLLVSDEIHGDLVFKGPAYTPIFALPEDLLANTVALVSPSKSFNVAALHAATIICPDENTRAIISRGINNDEIAEPNLLSIPATIAAYRDSGEWLDQLRDYLGANREYVATYLQQHLPQVSFASENATYLLWLDIAAYSDDAAVLAKFIRADSGLFLSAGTVYRGNGHHFLRLNVACPRATVEDGLNRLAQSLDHWCTQGGMQG